MGHKIIIMPDRAEEVAEAKPSMEAEQRSILEATASEMGRVAPRFFRILKSRMVRKIELPQDMSELGEPHLWVLHTLSKGRLLASELARQHNVANPTMTRTVDALAEKGLVDRAHDAGDRRCVYLQLTEPGVELSKYFEQQFHKALVEFLSPLSDEQLQDIMRAYRHMGSLIADAGHDGEARC